MTKKDEWVSGASGNPFHRRMTEVRSQMGGNLNEADALDLVKRGGLPSGNPFAQQLSTMGSRETISDDEVDKRAFFDKTTPTYNFRYMMRTFHRELVRARRYKRPMSVCVVIIDNLPAIEKQYGSFALDQCIMASAEALITCCRANVDMVGRYGDDRYIVLLPETPGTGAAVLCERVRKRFTQLEIQFQWHKIALTASIGISYYPGHGGDVEELIAQSDLAAEVVQEHGGNGIAYAPESPDPEASSESWS